MFLAFLIGLYTKIDRLIFGVALLLWILPITNVTRLWYGKTNFCQWKYMTTSNTIDTLYFTFLTSNRPLCLKLRLNEWSKAQQPLLWTNIEAGYYIVYILNTYIHTEHYIYKEAVEIRRRLKTPSKLYWTLVTDRVFETYIRFRVFEVHWKKGF